MPPGGAFQAPPSVEASAIFRVFTRNTCAAKLSSRILSDLLVRANNAVIIVIVLERINRRSIPVERVSGAVVARCLRKAILVLSGPADRTGCRARSYSVLSWKAARASDGPITRRIESGFARLARRVGGGPTHAALFPRRARIAFLLRRAARKTARVTERARTL